MAERHERQAEHELQERRERERADLEVESTIGPRPLEGLSEAPRTLWPQDEQDDSVAREEHGDDEARSRAASLKQAGGEGEAEGG